MVLEIDMTCNPPQVKPKLLWMMQCDSDLVFDEGISFKHQ